MKPKSAGNEFLMKENTHTDRHSFFDRALGLSLSLSLSLCLSVGLSVLSDLPRTHSFGLTIPNALHLRSQASMVFQGSAASTGEDIPKSSGPGLVSLDQDRLMGLG